jgi:hypothetical protein
VGVEFFHADGPTYMTKLIVAFRNFSKAPKSSVFQFVEGMLDVDLPMLQVRIKFPGLKRRTMKSPSFSGNCCVSS